MAGEKWIVVVGGSGALGSAFIEHASGLGFKTCCIDLRPNPRADLNQTPSDNVNDHLLQNVEAVIGAAGSWAGGSLKEVKLVNDPLDTLYQTNVKSAMLAAAIGCQSSASCIMLTGAWAAHRQGCQSMAAYGAVKRAVEGIAESISDNKKAILLLPQVLDTLANRRDMGKPDGSPDWADCGVIAKHVLDSFTRIKGTGLERIRVYGKEGETVFESV